MNCNCNCCSNGSNNQNINIAVNNALNEINEKIVEAHAILDAAKNTACVKPDYEDINLNSHGELQSANREYNSSLYIGKGWKILRRKEIECTCNCCNNNCCKKCKWSNILTQDDFLEPNTIYVVRYDFDLNGKKITLPKGCELRFEGGSISNGEIDMNGGKITGMMGDIEDYFKNVNVYNYCDGQIIWKDGNLYVWSENHWKLISSLTLDDVQNAINKGAGVIMTMPSENSNMLSLPFKTLTLEEYNRITPVEGITYNII